MHHHRHSVQSQGAHLLWFLFIAPYDSDIPDFGSIAAYLLVVHITRIPKSQALSPNATEVRTD